MQRDRWLATYGALGLVLVALLAFVGWWALTPDARAPEEPPAPPPPPQLATPQPAPADPMERAVLKALAQADAGTLPEEITVDQLGPGDGQGIYAFPKPGTKPLKVGLVVPDDFPLPPGYMRHYQTTDDGKQLPPILMFHPDYHPEGVTIPPDRIVPPELAPPGMPHNLLELPAPKAQ